VVPGLVMFQMMIDHSSTAVVAHMQQWFPYLGFFITLGSCYRLWILIWYRQTDFYRFAYASKCLVYFKLALGVKIYFSLILIELLTTPGFISDICFCLYVECWNLMLFSLKIKKFSFKENALQIVFWLCPFTIDILALFRIPLVIIFYVVLSVVNNKVLKVVLMKRKRS
jgi:CDP-diacylglycerol--serine O-phosphatidyltransferase